MVERQDIDALLVGALYGELTPAEEARLQAHLESHPADRTALDDLKSARAAVRDSRVFDLQAEPPQAVSALLLQEAHRRAPRHAPEERAKESWFARLARSFVMHPAMAAAATLVLVIGVAGGLYLSKGGDQLDHRAAGTDNAEQKNAPAAAAPELDHGATGGAMEAAAGSAAAPAPEPQAGDTYEVKLADKRAEAQTAQASTPAFAATPGPTPAKPTAHASRSDGIVVSRPEAQPKDLDRAKAGYKGDDGDIARDVGGVGGGGRASSGLAYGPSANGAPAASAAPPPPPVAAPAQEAPTAAATPAPSAAKLRKVAPSGGADEDMPATKEAGKVAEDDTWAAGRYSVALGYVKQNDCNSAASIAFGIKARAPSYYAANVETDISIKKCISYVNQLTEKSAAASKKAAPAKAKAAPPAAADEKPATTTK